MGTGSSVKATVSTAVALCCTIDYLCLCLTCSKSVLLQCPVNEGLLLESLEGIRWSTQSVCHVQLMCLRFQKNQEKLSNGRDVAVRERKDNGEFYGAEARTTASHMSKSAHD